MKDAAVFGLAIILFTFPAMAQDNGFIERLMAEDPGAVEAVIMYPEAVREAIFEASANPGALVRISNLQSRTKTEFQALLKDLNSDDQKKVWELSRYPGLVAFMGGEKRPSASALDNELQKYPEAIHSVAKEFRGKKRTYVISLRELNEAANASYEQLTETYSTEDAAAFKTLIDMPEVLDILTRNIAFTAELGDIYRHNPEGVKARAAKMQLEAARKNAETDNDWATAIQDDPEAMAELEQSAKDFASEDTTPAYVYRAPQPTSSITLTVHYYPYSYWYGYPTWHRYAFWYPRPHWYHTGFYVTANGTIIIVGTPSYHYTHWHFYGYHHHYHYSHLSYHYARHYDHFRHYNHGAADAIRDWERDNSDRLPKDWASERSDGAKRFKDFGQKNGERSLVEVGRSRPLTAPTRSRVERGERSAGERRQTAAESHDRRWGTKSGNDGQNRGKNPGRGDRSRRD